MENANHGQAVSGRGCPPTLSAGSVQPGQAALLIVVLAKNDEDLVAGDGAPVVRDALGCRGPFEDRVGRSREVAASDKNPSAAVRVSDSLPSADGLLSRGPRREGRLGNLTRRVLERHVVEEHRRHDKGG